MSRKELTTIGPAPYAAWRATSLGAITEAIEQRLILDMIGGVEGARVLDAGCGDGVLVCLMTARGAEATGVDPDPAMLAAARSRAAKAGVDAAFLVGRVERLPFPDASFDVVFSVIVLCFTPEAASAVHELARVLRPGGRLVLGELGRWSLWAALRRVRGWLGAETWKAARFRSASELGSLAEQAGLSVIAIRGAVYYPPVSAFARALAPIDARLGRLTTFGAAFIALGAVSVDQPWKQ
ncbi:class I SAM-dependent methyltransferase [Rhodoblastus sp.]|jgi:SAM-dependent methyltransferase|uniref:class I SAM-dependent methyltransferase n=1 Tax=Rhodoblastus sp. TaxID=1962975 RepID=UPI0025E856B9|nr:class I SAM-dependent methyltransferase [Rhodoblastus sp.]